MPITSEMRRRAGIAATPVGATLTGAMRAAACRLRSKRLSRPADQDRLCLDMDPIAAQLRIDGALGKAERRRRGRYIAVARAERTYDEVPFGRLDEREAMLAAAGGLRPDRVGLLRTLDGAATRQHEAFDQVAQFAHVAKSEHAPPRSSNSGRHGMLSLHTLLEVDDLFRASCDRPRFSRHHRYGWTPDCA